MLEGKTARTMVKPTALWTLSRESGTKDYLNNYQPFTAKNIGSLMASADAGNGMSVVSKNWAHLKPN